MALCAQQLLDAGVPRIVVLCLLLLHMSENLRHTEAGL